MRSKRPLAPAFLNQLDHYLLLNQPVIWTTRAHLVVYYSILFAATLTLLCWLVPDNPIASSNSFSWTTLTAVLSFIGLIIWIIYLLRFNVFKRFGESGRLDAVKNFLLFFFSVGCIIAPAYIPTAIESVRANMAFGNEEVVNDINSIHIKINQLEYDSLDHTWSKETVIVRDTLELQLLYRQNDDPDNNKIRYIDTANLRRKLAETDSVFQENDSLYYFYTCPKYTFLRGPMADNYTTAKQIESREIYHNFIQHFKPVDKEATKKELHEILNKYRYQESFSRYYQEDDYDNPTQSYYNVIDKRYDLYPVYSGLVNLVDKKYRWYSNNDFRVRVWFYLSFVITLLLFIFRHSTTKSFFLTLLTCIVLAILSALALAFLHSDERSVYILFIVYYLLFIGIVVAGISRGTRNTINAIALNIVTFFTFTIPLICTLLYYVGQERLYRSQPTYPPGYYETKDLHFLLAEITGVLLTVILLQPVFKWLYRNWFAKPVE